jgi:hypothetical protein
MIPLMRTVPALALLLAGCVVAEPRPPPPPAAPPPPPPPAARRALIGEREAVRIAANFARSRGLDVQRYRARLDGQERWLVELRAQGGVDRAKVLVDATDGRVLRAKLRREDPDW